MLGHRPGADDNQFCFLIVQPQHVTVHPGTHYGNTRLQSLNGLMLSRRLDTVPLPDMVPSSWHRSSSEHDTLFMARLFVLPWFLFHGTVPLSGTVLLPGMVLQRCLSSNIIESDINIHLIWKMKNIGIHTGYGHTEPQIRLSWYVLPTQSRPSPHCLNPGPPKKKWNKNVTLTWYNNTSTQ